LRPSPVIALLLIAGALGPAVPAWGQQAEADGPAPTPAADTTASSARAAAARLAGDTEAYFTAPLRWNAEDWAWFGGALLAIGVSHHYDSQVRAHFASGTGVPNSDDLQDAVPTAAVIGLTWAYAFAIDDSAGRGEAWNMVEATALSGITAYGLKFAAGREPPDETTDPNEWGKGGNSFPSLHATAAFAVGTVLAESGNDEYRFVRRLLGYGLGVLTSYERLKHDAHWLSDTVAGAALGAASAHFVMNRRLAADAEAHLRLVPIDRGAMLTYSVSLD
jgi:membrane-associated phospholipid phosphatase